MKLGRNDPCHCGSGLKYKKCHLDKDAAATTAQYAAEAAERKALAEKNAAEAAEKAKTEGAEPAHTGHQRPANPSDKLGKQARSGGAAPLFRRRAV